MIIKEIFGNTKNFIFIGEAGSGKSEISLNLAIWLKTLGKKQVDFFDMDMTKHLFRSRDVREAMESAGVGFHYEEQFMDAPTLVGGVRKALKDENRYVIMDVGGNDTGARSIGGFAPLLNQGNTMIFYVLNAFRPWSIDIDHIDYTLAQILAASHIELGKLHMVNNSNNGPSTTKEEFISASKRLKEVIEPYAKIDFSCVFGEIYEQVKGEWDEPLFPLHLNLKYPWL